MPVRAAQYLRTSSASQQSSLHTQAETIAGYAAANSYEVVRTYVDVGLSGVTIKRRAGLKQLIADVQIGPEFSVVLVSDVSRWGRFQDPDEAAYLEFLCRQAGVSIEYCFESFQNDGTLSAALIKGMRRVMAAEYSRQVSSTARAGMRRAALAGCWSGTRPPFGFGRAACDETGRPEQILLPGERPPRIDQQVRVVLGPASEVAIVRGIFELFVLERFSVNQICKILNGAGIPRRQHDLWTRYTVTSVLRCELAIGYQVYNRIRTELGVHHPIAESEWMRVKVLPPLISRALFDAARQRLADPDGAYANASAIARLTRARNRARRLLSEEENAASDLAPLLYARNTASLKTATRQLMRRGSGSDANRPDEIAGYSRRQIVTRLKTLYRRHGRLSQYLINSAKHLPSAKTLANHFGGMVGVYDLVGFTPSTETAGRAVQQGRAHGRMMDKRRRLGRRPGPPQRRVRSGEVESDPRSGRSPEPGA